MLHISSDSEVFISYVIYKIVIYVAASQSTFFHSRTTTFLVFRRLREAAMKRDYYPRHVCPAVSLQQTWLSNLEFLLKFVETCRLGCKSDKNNRNFTSTPKFFILRCDLFLDLRHIEFSLRYELRQKHTTISNNSLAWLSATNPV
jgi:hypothetical protein